MNCFDYICKVIIDVMAFFIIKHVKIYNIMKRSINPVNLCTVKDYAKMMGVTIQTVYRWLKDGKIQKVEFLGKEFIDKSTYRA